MQLSCLACGQKIESDDINIDMAIAKCRQCHAVFSFADQIRGSLADAPAARRPRPQAAQPKHIVVDDISPSELTLTFRWYRHSILFLLFFCIFWDGFLVMWYSIALASKAPIIMFVFPIIHLTVGGVLTYFVIASLLNSTRIQVSQGQLIVHHGPVPWFGNQRIDSSDIRQFYCTEAVHRNKGRVSYTYVVNVMRRDNTRLKLVSGLVELEEALFIEQCLEQHLRIKDEPIAGEVTR